MSKDRDISIDSLLPPKYRSRDYWNDRQARAQAIKTKKNTKLIEAQLRKYYRKAMDEVVEEFEFTYLKLLEGKHDGIKPTPADLYNLSRYWEMQGQITKVLNKLGDAQASFLRIMFRRHYGDIYNSIALGTSEEFSRIDKAAVEQVINQIWCADGKTWADRIWGNTEELREALNEGLVTCVATGSNTEDLKRALQIRFNVSYGRADTLVKTELAHIQTQAAADRYRNAGVKEFQVWADEDERRCEICGKLHKKKYLVGENPPIPAHPRCRCTIVPVIERRTK